MDKKKLDIAIIGAGPTGLSFALSLAQSGLKIAIIDKQSIENIAQPQFDGRDIAMTHLSKTILSELGVWQTFPADVIHLIKEAKVINGDLNTLSNESTSTLEFDRSDDPNAPLGYLVANYQIRQALYNQVKAQPNISFLCEQKINKLDTSKDTCLIESDDALIECKLLVSSDSRFSETRRMMGLSAKMKDYGKVMLVCHMKHEGNHNNTAQECFQYDKTCAILPLAENTSSIVITVNASESERLLALDDLAFCAEAQSMLNHRLGKMTLISQPIAYPLVGVMSDRFISQNFALIGDAAVGMHPVTAHGFNLGLRSADTLAQQIIKAHTKGKNIASKRLLHEYEARHKLLSKPLYDATNTIVALYTNKAPLAKAVRKIGIRLGNKILPFKRLVTHRLTQVR